jgi:hypothetical protein
MHTLGSIHLALDVDHTLGAEWSGLDGRSSSHACGARANDLAIHAVEPDQLYYTPERGVTASHEGEEIIVGRHSSLIAV